METGLYIHMNKIYMYGSPLYLWLLFVALWRVPYYFRMNEWCGKVESFIQFHECGSKKVFTGLFFPFHF